MQDTATPDAIRASHTLGRTSTAIKTILRHKYVVAVLFAVIAVTAGVVSWQSRPVSPTWVTEPVTRGNIVKSIVTTGTINPVVTVQVGTYVSGVIESLHCDYNTQVKAGQLCAKIDPRPYQLAVDQAAANLAIARAQIEKDKASLVNFKTTYDRDRSLLKEGIVSQETIDDDKAAFDQATAQIALDGAAIRQREAALNAAQVNLGYTDIVSPVDGVVVSRNIDVGQTVAASFQTPTLFLIAKDLTKMQVDTNVSESDIGGVQVGQRASFVVEAYPDRTFWGKVTQIRKAPINVQNVVTYNVVVSVDNPELVLLPGMTANTRIIVAERDNVLRVPLQAIRFTPPNALPRAGAPASKSQPASRIWLLHGRSPTPVTVSAGLADNTYVEITGDGVKPGDHVIVNAVTGPGGGGARQRSPLRF